MGGGAVPLVPCNLENCWRVSVAVMRSFFYSKNRNFGHRALAPPSPPPPRDRDLRDRPSGREKNTDVLMFWRFRSTFWPGNYVWTLSPWDWALLEALDALRPGFCIEFRYLSYRQSGLAWGAISEENH